MNAVLGRRIVAGWGRNGFNMPTFRVHPIDYPEIEAEGRTPDEACDRLVLLLVQAMDFVIETWKCQPLGLALADARAFATVARTEPEPSASSLALTRPGPPAHFPAAGIIQEAILGRDHDSSDNDPWSDPAGGSTAAGRSRRGRRHSAIRARSAPVGARVSGSA